MSRLTGLWRRYFNLFPKPAASILDATTHSYLDIPRALTGGNRQLIEEFFSAAAKLKPAVFCDIGANAGETALRAHSQLAASVYAFEANPLIHAAHSERMSLIGIGWHNLAVTSEDGPVDIHVPSRISKVLQNGRLIDQNHYEDESTGKGSLLRRAEDADYNLHIVQGVTLDGFLAEASPAGDVALWIDVEGAASLVLAGAKRTLERTKIILVEVEGYKFWQKQSGAADIFRTLIEAGFTPVYRDQEFGDHQCNVLFARDDLTTDLWPSPTDYPKQGNVPALVPCFNNPTYCELMLNQLWRVGFRDIRFVDNASTGDQMREWLGRSDGRRKVVQMPDNYGPNVVFDHLMDTVPGSFCLSDPDIGFNPHLPSDFLTVLQSLTHRHAVGKAGFALDLSHVDPTKTIVLNGDQYTVRGWEERFWQKPLHLTNEGDRVFEAWVDTTFCLVDRRYLNQSNRLLGVRVAGHFTAKHLPWEGRVTVPGDEAATYRSSQLFSNYGL